MKVADLVMIDPDVLGGTPVFKGIRAPAKALFEYLETAVRPTDYQNVFRL